MRRGIFRNKNHHLVLNDQNSVNISAQLVNISRILIFLTHLFRTVYRFIIQNTFFFCSFRRSADLWNGFNTGDVFLKHLKTVWITTLQFYKSPTDPGTVLWIFQFLVIHSTHFLKMTAGTICSILGVSYRSKVEALSFPKMSDFNIKIISCPDSKILSITQNSGFADQSDFSNFRRNSLKIFIDSLSLIPRYL